MEIKSIVHTGITVRSLEKSIPFYRDVLGLKQVNEPEPLKEPNAEEGIAVGVGKPVSSHTVLFETANGQTIELLEYAEPKAPNDKPLTQNALGAMHVSFEVEDINAWVKRLTEQGVKFYYEPKLILNGAMKDIWWCYFEDPDGIVLELMELPKK